MADFVFHHLSGAIFGVGLFAMFLAHRWMKEATEGVNRATKFYDDASELHRSAAAEKIATTHERIQADRSLALAKVERGQTLSEGTDRG